MSGMNSHNYTVEHNLIRNGIFRLSYQGCFSDMDHPAIMRSYFPFLVNINVCRTAFLFNQATAGDTEF